MILHSRIDLACCMCGFAYSSLCLSSALFFLSPVRRRLPFIIFRYRGWKFMLFMTSSQVEDAVCQFKIVDAYWKQWELEVQFDRPDMSCQTMLLSVTDLLFVEEAHVAAYVAFCGFDTHRRQRTQTPQSCFDGMLETLLLSIGACCSRHRQLGCWNRGNHAISSSWSDSESEGT